MSSPHLPISFWRTAHGVDLLRLTEKLAEELGADPAALALKLKSTARSFTGAEVNGAIDLVIARHKAAPRLGEWCQNAYLSCRSVEQASRPEIAQHRAEMFRGAQRILEVGTGAGFDTAYLARLGGEITSLEPDPLLADMARHNLAVQGFTNVEIINTTFEDYLTASPLSRYDAIYADPSRRDLGGARLRSGEDYLPPLSAITELSFEGTIGIKISPALDLELPSGWRRQFIGFDSECLEQTLWRGLASPPPVVHLADCDASWGDTAAEPDTVPPSEELVGYLLDPHPALTRSHAVQSFYAAHSVRDLDPRSPYGISSAPLFTPFARLFRILESAPYRLRDLKGRLHDLRWTNRTEIKKRGVADDPDDVRSKLKLPRHRTSSDPFGVVLLARRGDGVVFILAERVPAPKE
ncbi:MAG: hypothetical protein RL417_1452 [Pseudomonadota bacterium]|jgi:hypothetical protein